METYRLPSRRALSLSSVPKAGDFDGLYACKLRVWYVLDSLYIISKSEGVSVFYWNFYLDGTVELEIRLTGILSV